MTCYICQKEFHPLGFPSHRASCRRKEIKRNEQLVELFNEKFPVGSKVMWRPSQHDDFKEYEVKCPAYLDHGRAIVFFMGKPGYCSIDKIFVDYESN